MVKHLSVKKEGNFLGKKNVIPSQKMTLTKQRDFFIKIKSRLVKKNGHRGTVLEFWLVVFLLGNNF